MSKYMYCCIMYIRGRFDTNRDGHHDGKVVGRGGQIPFSENALSGCVFLWSKYARE